MVYYKKIIAIAIVMAFVIMAFGSVSNAINPAGKFNGYSGAVYIYSSGAVSVPGLFTITGTNYTLNENINGSLVIEDHGITVYGNSHIINGTKPIFANNSGNLTISGFTLTNSSKGIYILNSIGVSISDINVNRSYDAIELIQDSFVYLNNLDISNATYGIYLSAVQQSSISNSRLYNDEYGIYLYYVNNISISGVSVSGGQYNVYAYYAEGTYISNAVLSSADYGIDVSYSNDISMYYSTISDQTDYGVYTDFVNGVYVSGDYFYSDVYGMYVTETENFSATGSTYISNTYGLYLIYDTGASVSHSTFTDGQYGIFIDSYSDIMIYNNTFASSLQFGIYAEYVQGMNISGGSFSSTGGIEVIDYSSGVTLTEVTSNSEAFGVLIQQSHSIAINNANFMDDNYAMIVNGSANISANKVNIQGGGYGIYSQNSNYTDIRNFDINSTLQYAIYTILDFHFEVYNSSFVNDEYIYLVGGTYVFYGDKLVSTFQSEFYAYAYSYSYLPEQLTISHDVFVETTIYDYYSDEYYTNSLTVTNSQFFDSPYGVYSYYASSITIEDSNFTNTNYSLYSYEDYMPQIISGNNFIGNSFVYMYYDFAPLTISGNHFNNTAVYSIELVDIFYVPSSVSNNVLIGGSIYLDEGYLVNIENNVLRGDSHSYRNAITLADSSTYNYILNNDISNYSVGVLLNGSSYNYVGGNYISAKYGISIYASNNDSVYANTINGSAFDLYLNQSYSNIFYSNNFLGNYKIFLENTRNISWDDMDYETGNYYANVSGPSSNNILTSPHTISYGNIDLYPLASPYRIYTLTIRAVGLPEGVSWNLEIDGHTYKVTGSSFVYYITDDRYHHIPYNVPDIYGYTVTNGTGSVQFIGKNASVDVYFTQVIFTVSFIESGLPAGTTWGVSITGIGSITNAGSQIREILFNGTYEFSVFTTDHDYMPSFYNGTFVVNGTSKNISIVFRPVLFTVTFREEGLPDSYSWYVNLSSGASTGAVSGLTNAYTLSLTNGSYTYQPADNYKIMYAAGGTFTINGKPTNLTVVFSEYKIPVTFTQSGLSTDSVWYVNFTNDVSGSTTSVNSLVFNLVNGTYPYIVSTSNKSFQPVSEYGIVVVSGVSISVTVEFKPVLYVQYFMVYVLPAGASWSLELDGVHYSSYNPFISVPLTNGTYSFTVKLNGKNYNSSLTVDGTDAVIVLGYNSGTAYNAQMSVTSLYTEIMVLGIIPLLGAVFLIRRMN